MIDDRLPARWVIVARVICVLLSALSLIALLANLLGARASADPAEPPPPPLPVVAPTPSSNWQPKFPSPYDETRKNVTQADINAEREMCQWFNAQ